MQHESVEKMAAQIAGMDRQHVLDLLMNMQCTFPLDFTQEFFESLSIERLRHIALAASLHRLRAA
jgi:hypothetical protein